MRTSATLCTLLDDLQAAALAAAAEKDAVAERIGAANTLVRRPDGSLAAYNTDWSAAISAIERGMTSGAGMSARRATREVAKNIGKTAMEMRANSACDPLFDMQTMAATAAAAAAAAAHHWQGRRCWCWAWAAPDEPSLLAPCKLAQRWPDSTSHTFH